MAPGPEVRWHHALLHGQRIRSRWRLPHLPAWDSALDSASDAALDPGDESGDESGDDAVELTIAPTAALDTETDDFDTLLTTTRATTEERSIFSLSRTGSDVSAVDRLCWDRLCDVRLSADRLDCGVFHGSDRHEVEARLLGPATAYWLERLGHPALHASALALDGRAVAVAGHSGAGKSTFAAAGWSAGASILADDLCGVQIEGGRPVVYPGPAWIRLEPEIARRFGLPFPRRARHRRGKVRVHLGARPTKAHTLAALILLSPRDGHRVRLHDLNPVDAFARLQAVSYVGPDVAQRAGFETSRFLSLTQTLDEVPVYEMVLPDDVDEAQRAVAETVERLLN